MSGWHVAALPVAALRALGLRVEADPTPEDAGHCLIKPLAGDDFDGDKVWSKLAKQTRVVYTHPS